MAGWSGGTFSGQYRWTEDRDNAIKIVASRHEEQDNVFINGINNTLTKDGQNSATANLPMATNKHTGVGNATARDQYLAMGQFQDQSGVYVTTGGAADVYTLGASPAITAYTAGQRFVIRIHAANTGATTIDVNGVGAKAINKGDGTTALAAGDLTLNQIYVIVYDGTQFQLINEATVEDDSITTAKIADNAVTLSKLEHGTQGDILYYGASGEPFRLGAGTSGQFLKTQGAGSNPVWAENAVNDQQLCKAWVNFDGSGVVSIRDDYNVTSITDNGTGNYTVNLTSAMSNANYSAVPGCSFDTTGSSNLGAQPLARTYATNSVVVLTANSSGILSDMSIVTLHVFGDQ